MNTTTFWIQIVIGCIWLVSDYISYAILYSLRKTDRGNIFFIGFLLDPITFLLTLAVIKFGIFGEMLVPLQVFAHLISIAKLLPYFCFTYLFFSRNFDKVFLCCILLMISMDSLSLLAVVKMDIEWKFGLFYLMYYIKIGFSFVFAITFLGFRYRKKIDFKKQSTLLTVGLLMTIGGFIAGSQLGYSKVVKPDQFYIASNYALNNYLINIEVQKNINNKNISGAIDLTKNALESNKKTIKDCFDLDLKLCKTFIEYRLSQEAPELLHHNEY